jgi:hypothetical protein
VDKVETSGISGSYYLWWIVLQYFGMAIYVSCVMQIELDCVGCRVSLLKLGICI